MSRLDVHGNMRGRKAADERAETLLRVSAGDSDLSQFLQAVRTLSVANPPRPSEDLAVLLADGFVPETGQAPAVRPRAGRHGVRRWLARGAITAPPLAWKIAAVTAAAAVTAGGLAAGVLPDPAQRWVSDAASILGIDLPAPVGKPTPVESAQDPGPAVPPDDLVAPAPDRHRAAGESRTDDERDAAEEERDAAEDRADDERDAAEEERDAAEDRADDERDAAEERADDEEDAAEERADDEEDAAEDRADDEEDAAEDGEDEASTADRREDSHEASDDADDGDGADEADDDDEARVDEPAEDAAADGPEDLLPESGEADEPGDD